MDESDTYSLKQVIDAAGRAVQSALPARFWVVAEVAAISGTGHLYLELVQKEGGALLAKAKAMIWQSNARTILSQYQATSGQRLAPGMNILILASAQMHPLYSFGLTIHSIDGNFTVGEMARQKREVIERLAREGLLEINKDLAMPLVLQRIAIVSSRTAAGYGDFVDQLQRNTAGYCFAHRLFEAAMQGETTERSIIAALHKARAVIDQFDVVVLIRGGGATTDLHWFDSYALAKELATFPAPVITGIGHERDESVADLVAHHRCKTPTAAAEFIIQTAASFEEALAELEHRSVRAATMRLERAQHEIAAIHRKLQVGVMHAVRRRGDDLRTCQERLRSAALLMIQREKSAIERHADKIRLLDPINVLRRGFSLVYGRGGLLTSAANTQVGEALRVRLADGELTAGVTDVDLTTRNEENGTDGI